MYLKKKHFIGMVVVAASVHIMAAVIWLLMPGLKVNKIPVHVLNIKLGSGELLALAETTTRAVPVLDAAAEKSAAQPVPVKPPYQHEREKLAPLPKPVKSDTAPEVKKTPTVKPSQPAAQKQAAKPNVARDAAPKAVSTASVRSDATPSEYVRNMGAEGGVGEGSPLGTAKDAEDAMRRYEQLLSIWIQRYKVYPEQARREGMQGRALIRIRIDRAGNIKRFRLDQSTGSTMLDDAILTMVRAADPVPPVPRDYPGGELIEFIIPVGFKLRES